ncbi:MAG TPA: response regulator [Chondromyces sp.]|nr:response regulator [Chondromyces sp.]
MTSSSRTLLIVEDDASMRQSMERLVAAAGFSVLAYESAEALLAAGVPRDAGCIISDLRLPGASGIELLALLRTHGCSTPLIVITAFDTPGLVHEAIDAGAAAYLVKPFLGSDLLEAVRTAIADLASKNGGAGD